MYKQINRHTHNQTSMNIARRTEGQWTNTLKAKQTDDRQTDQQLNGQIDKINNQAIDKQRID